MKDLPTHPRLRLTPDQIRALRRGLAERAAGEPVIASEPHTVSAPRLPVFLCSPYRGAPFTNGEYAKAAMLDSLGRGEAPFVPHLLYTLVLDDSVPAQRNQGIEAAFAYLARASRLAMYVDRGVSEGMRSEEVFATRLGITVERRSLPEWKD